MTGEIIDRPNPGAKPSLIPDEVLSLSVKLDKLNISDADLKALGDFRRASNYIAAGLYPHTKTIFSGLGTNQILQL